MSNTGLDVFLKSPYAPLQETDNHPKHQDFIYTEKRKTSRSKKDNQTEKLKKETELWLVSFSIIIKLTKIKYSI